MTEQTEEPTSQESEESPQVYQIRLDLKGIRPPIWRRLLLPSNVPLDGVHNIIQVAMGWTDSHLHSFTSGGYEFGDIRVDDYGLDLLDERLVALDEFLVKVGDRLDYEYDFGDGWQHVLKLEKILPWDPDVEYPICLTGRRACPPEDVGGIWGYMEFLEALADEGHPEHEAYIDWYGEDFDSEAFDAEATSEALQDVMLGIEQVAEPPHAITLVRLQMLSHELVDLIPHQLQLGMDIAEQSDATRRRWARRIRRAKSASELLDLLPIDHLSLLIEWMERWQAFSPDIAQLAVERMAAPDAWSEEHQRWAKERLACALHRLGPAATRPLIEGFETLDGYGKALACVVLGQLGVREASDAIWRFYVDAYETPENGWFLGPLWALVDLADPRAADAIAQVLEDDWDFNELAAIAGRAGDHRALVPLLGWMMLNLPKPMREVTGATVLVAHRIGREAIIQALGSLRLTQLSDAPEVAPADIADQLLAIPVEEAGAAIETYFVPTKLEDLIADMMDEDLLYDSPYSDLLWDLEEDEDKEAWIDSDVEPPVDPGMSPISWLTSSQPETRSRPRLDRNDPCWCGSGKKYKHCHWREDQEKDIPRAA
jgi:hypothetical protein